MSNHAGSYLLNEVLILLDEQKVFDFFGQEKTLDFLEKIRKIGMYHDCNSGEILDKIGEKLQVCYSCWEYNDNFEHGICLKCRERWAS